MVRGGSGLAFALILIALLVLFVFLFNNFPAVTFPTQLDPSVVFGPRSNKPPSSAKEGAARAAPLYLDQVLYLPLVLN